MADHLLQQTISREDAELAAYYQRGMQVDPDGHTVAEPRRDMDPRVAEKLGIDQNKPLDRTAIANLLNGLKTDGTEIEGKRQHHEKVKDEDGNLRDNEKERISYIDMCFSADKSVSIAQAFEETLAGRAVFLGAHDKAINQVMAYIEKEIALASKGSGDNQTYEPGKLGFVKFTHFTSRETLALRKDEHGSDKLTFAKDNEARTGKDSIVDLKVAGDMNIHTHVAVMNMVLTEDGRVGSIPLQKIKGRIHEFGAVYQAFLATNLRDAGIETVLDEKTGAAKVVGIPDPVRNGFSKRTRDAHETARQHAIDEGVNWDGMTEPDRIKWVKGGARASRRSTADDMSDRDSWRAQAKAMGWEYKSVIGKYKAEEITDEKRLDHAYKQSLPYIEKHFHTRSVITGWDAREAAARGLIASGIKSSDDVSAVTKLMRDKGVRQEGSMTDLVVARAHKEKGQEVVRMTTGLHIWQEKEFVRLVKAAAKDKSLSLTPKQIEAAARNSGLDFTTEHGKTQRAMMETLGTGGKVSVAIGIAGSGKTAVIAPLVEAWKGRGLKVYGGALAWRQSDDLAQSGIGKENSFALHALLHKAKSGHLKLDNKSVVVIDEVGLIGIRQSLDLVRLQKRHGFKIVAVGDDKQSQAIEAGPVIELMRRALGKEHVPEILTTIRQQTERERDISLLFRDGKAGKALAMKREDATAEAVPGGYRDAVNRVADLWQERRHANHNDKNFSITISAPTNADAREISNEIRNRRRDMGEIGNDIIVVPATDQYAKEKGTKYDLPLAIGDKVRLFDRANASFGTHGGMIGNNGSVLEIVQVDKQKVLLRANTGIEGWVKWDTLRDKDTGRIRLAYGYAGTVDSQQGLTSDEHIDAMPAGSKALQAFKAYVAESRHRVKSFLITSEGAERQEIVDKRPLGSVRAITEKEIWKNIADNLSRQPEKLTATKFVEAAGEVRQYSARRMQQNMQRSEQRAASGQRATAAKERFSQGRASAHLQKVAGRMAESAVQRQETAAEFEIRAEKLREALASIPDDTQDMAQDWANNFIKESGRQKSGRETLREAVSADQKNSEQAPSRKEPWKNWQPKVRQDFDPNHIKALKDSVSITHLISQSIKLGRDGKAHCPFHNERTESFHVHEKTGHYHCYGCSAHGDAISWLKDYNKLSFRDAVSYLEGKTGITLPPPISHGVVKAEKWVAVPVPAGMKLMDGNGRTAKIHNPKDTVEGTKKEWASYRPQHVAEYRDENNRLMGYVVRVEIKNPDGAKDRKYTPQVTWVVPANAPKDADPVKVGRWSLTVMQGPRPMYHAEKLAKFPDAPVIVVAGEKKADTLQKAMGDTAVVVSWAGGDNARKYVDFSPLKGRDVTIWPDNDISGLGSAVGNYDPSGKLRKGAGEIIANAGASSVAVVIPPANLPKGWDAGDMVASGARVSAVKEFIQKYSIPLHDAEDLHRTKPTVQKSRGSELSH